MKRTNTLRTIVLLLPAFFLLNGCIAIGNRDAQRPNATLGQQLIDLQKARDTGAITDAEYQSQKSRLLNPK
jgi:hypothetical protein